MILSIHTGHDANLTISKDREILIYVEFEKVVKERYFKFYPDHRFEEQFDRLVLPLILDYIDKLTTINFCWLTDFQRDIIKKKIPNRVYNERKHHLSHAYSLYAFTTPNPKDLIISIDGGGDENDFFKIFNWQNGKIETLANIPLNLGTPYRIIGLISKELKTNPVFEFETNLHLPGRIMGLHSLGHLKPEYIEPLIEFYQKFNSRVANIKIELKSLLDRLRVEYDDQLKTDNEISRNILFTSQFVFEKLFFDNAAKYLKSAKYDRILLVGGCALNVRLNSEIYSFSKKDVFVSPVSGDCGITLGAAIFEMNVSTFKPYENSFIGLPYSGNLKFKIAERKGLPVSEVFIAQLLAEGNIIAIMVGKIEAGPRALGNRSLLASPLYRGIKQKLNSVKEREFFRPIAPIVRDISQDKYFETCPPSVFMTFSPKIKRDYKSLLSEIVHYDDTCRIQTITKDELFLYQLLEAFEAITGFDILVNTSFNIKGKPIVNDIDDAFSIMDMSNIDYLYIDGYLFSKL